MIKEIIGYTTAITVLPKVDSGPDTNGHEYVDLGLPSGKLWSAEVFIIDTLQLQEIPSIESLLGGNWRIPTKEEYLELINNVNVIFNYLTGQFALVSKNDSSKALVFSAITSFSQINGFGGRGLYLSNSWNDSEQVYMMSINGIRYFNGNIESTAWVLAYSPYPEKFGIIGIIG